MGNIFMCALEQKDLNGCPSQCKPLLYRRYFDDTFCLFRRRQHVDKFLKQVNNFHPNIKLTVEGEENDVLATYEQPGTFCDHMKNQKQILHEYDRVKRPLEKELKEKSVNHYTVENTILL